MYLKVLETDSSYWRSPISLPLIREQVLGYQNFNSVELTDSLKYAIALADQAFRLKEPVKMLHLNDLFNYPLHIWKRSPGLPWKSLGYKTKDEVRYDPRCRNSIRWFWHRIKAGERIGAPDCCAFTRSHLTEKGTNKIRAVWGYPMSMTMGEAVFAVPLIEAYQKQISPMAYGYDTALGGARRIIGESGNHASYCALDFSSFDKTVPAPLIQVAFSILLRNIDIVNYRDHGVADSRRILRMWRYIERYFIHTPIRLCNGERFRKHAGVASGSYFTQLIDSIVNYILVVWAGIEQGAPPEYIKVLGDDSIAGFRFKFSLDDAAALFKTIGMSVNIKKSMVSPTISRLTFLGYSINLGAPTKPHARWMAALLYPEHRDRSWDDVASRALGLCHAGFGLDDKFDTLCRTIIGLKPFDLHMDSSLARMLYMIGWDTISKEPPDKLMFLRRLGLI